LEKVLTPRYAVAVKIQNDGARQRSGLSSTRAPARDAPPGDDVIWIEARSASGARSFPHHLRARTTSRITSPAVTSRSTTWPPLPGGSSVQDVRRRLSSMSPCHALAGEGGAPGDRRPLIRPSASFSPPCGAKDTQPADVEHS
jgi:hypothetical protein